MELGWGGFDRAKLDILVLIGIPFSFHVVVQLFNVRLIVFKGLWVMHNRESHYNWKWLRTCRSYWQVLLAGLVAV